MLLAAPFLFPFSYLCKRFLSWTKWGGQEFVLFSLFSWYEGKVMHCAHNYTWGRPAEQHKQRLMLPRLALPSRSLLLHRLHTQWRDGQQPSGVLSLFFSILQKKIHFFFWWGRRSEPGGDVMRMDQRDNTENKYTHTHHHSVYLLLYSSTILYIYTHTLNIIFRGGGEWRLECASIRDAFLIMSTPSHSSAPLWLRGCTFFPFLYLFIFYFFGRGWGKNKSFDIDKGILFLFFWRIRLVENKKKTGLFGWIRGGRQ